MRSTIAVLGLLGKAAMASPFVDRRDPQIGGTPGNPQACTYTYETKKIEDGLDKRVWMFEQVTDFLECTSGGNGCETAFQKGKTVTLGFELSGTPLSEGFVSAGLSVEESIEESMNYNCLQNPGPGNTVCVWAQVEYRKYEVGQYMTAYPTCPRSSGWEDGTWFITAPVKDGKISFECRYNEDCGQEGDREWADM